MQGVVIADARAYGEDPTPRHLSAGWPLRLVFRDGDGNQRKQSARTLDEARRLKSAREADVARGEFHQLVRVRFREYAEE